MTPPKLKKYILAIDQGTTGSRSIIYDKKGNIKASAYQEFPQYFPRPGWVEHDPEEIWQSVNKTIQKVLTKISPTQIAAIGITNQRETTVIWDKNTGKPIHRAIVWQCRRTAQRCDQLKKIKGMEKKIRQKTGLPIDAYFSATKIEWILRNMGGRNVALHAQRNVETQHFASLQTRSRSNALHFGTTDTWILWKLTGGQSHATDYTNASRTMFFNIEKKKWDKDLLKLFSIPEKILPKVLPSSGNFGKTTKIGKLPADIPITGIAGDQQAALFGQNCFKPGTMKNTYGTGCFLLMNTGKKRVNSKYGLITTLGCDEKGKPCYVLEGAIFVAGAAIQWLRDELKIISSAAESEKIAKSLKNNEGVYFVPAFVGLGAPYWDPNARGTITGITRGTKRAHLVRAALEAMCYSTKDVVQVMEKELKIKNKELRVDGGAVANNFLCQLQANILGSKVVRPKIIETTSLGAAYLAGLEVGFWKHSQEIEKLWQKDKIFSHQRRKKEFDKYYKEWCTVVKMTLKSPFRGI